MSSRRQEDPKTRIRITACDSWDDFITELRIGEGRHVGGHIYRGHGDATWRLSSVFERWLVRQKGGNPERNLGELFGEGGLEKFRTMYLKPFQHSAYRLHDVQLPPKESINTWLALGRHHGLITPLLDWTRSPFIAAFFASIDAFKLKADDERLSVAARHGKGAAKSYGPSFENSVTGMGGGIVYPHEPFVIWALSCADEIFVKGEFQIVDEQEYSNARLHAQQGLFTYLTHDVHVDLENYLASRGLGHRLEKFVIPGQEAGKAIHDLELMGINYASLFPDLDGIAKQANMGNFWWYQKKGRDKKDNE